MRFMLKKRVAEVEEATKDMKFRPEFPKHIERYEVIRTSEEGSLKVEIMLINGLRAEVIDREIMDAIKEGKYIDTKFR